MELVVKAQEELHLGRIDEAQTYMHEALSIAPRDPNVLTAFGSMLADVGNVEKSLLTLKQAVRLEPDSGFEKYMCACRRYQTLRMDA
jgi:tetratricopeptide (TPR) repeat protein